MDHEVKASSDGVREDDGAGDSPESFVEHVPSAFFATRLWQKPKITGFKCTTEINVTVQRANRKEVVTILTARGRAVCPRWSGEENGHV